MVEKQMFKMHLASMSLYLLYGNERFITVLFRIGIRQKVNDEDKAKAHSRPCLGRGHSTRKCCPMNGLVAFFDNARIPPSSSLDAAGIRSQR